MSTDHPTPPPKLPTPEEVRERRYEMEWLHDMAASRPTRKRDPAPPVKPGRFRSGDSLD